MRRLYNELRKIIDALDRNKIDYALCGGIAMAVHGRPRATVAIDILIGEESVDSVIQLVAQLGYTIRGRDLNFDEIQIRRVSKVDRVSQELISLDMLVVTSEIQEIWQTRMKTNLEGGKLSVVSKDGLIALKKIAGRPQDLADIDALTRG